MRVLIVHTNEFMRRVLSRYVSRHLPGVTVVIAHTQAEAVAEMEKGACDIALLADVAWRRHDREDPVKADYNLRFLLDREGFPTKIIALDSKIDWFSETLRELANAVCRVDRLATELPEAFKRIGAPN